MEICFYNSKFCLTLQSTGEIVFHNVTLRIAKTNNNIQ